jgi:hypothetical protein
MKILIFDALSEKNISATHKPNLLWKSDVLRLKVSSSVEKEVI